jgi:hypothetical protein
MSVDVIVVVIEWDGMSFRRDPAFPRSWEDWGFLFSSIDGSGKFLRAIRFWPFLHTQRLISLASRRTTIRNYVTGTDPPVRRSPAHAVVPHVGNVEKCRGRIRPEWAAGINTRINIVTGNNVDGGNQIRVPP